MPPETWLAKLVSKRHEPSGRLSRSSQIAGLQCRIDRMDERPQLHEWVVDPSREVRHLCRRSPASRKRVHRPRGMEVVAEHVRQDL